MYFSRKAIEGLENYFAAKSEETNASADMKTASCHVPNKRFWWHLDQSLALLMPICNIIHHLEGDKSYISQMIPIWNKIQNSFKSWHQSLPSLPHNLAIFSGLPGEVLPFNEFMDLVESRMGKSVKPVMHLSHLLDPRFFLPRTNIFNEEVRCCSSEGVDTSAANACLQALASSLAINPDRVSVELSELASNKGTKDVLTKELVSANIVSVQLSLKIRIFGAKSCLEKWLHWKRF